MKIKAKKRLKIKARGENNMLEFRIIHFFTVLCALLMVFLSCSGCNSDASTSPGENINSGLSMKAAESGNIGSVNKASYEERRPSAATLILTVDSTPVYWPEFHFWLNYIVKYYKKAYGYDEITDWNVEQNGMPLSEFFLSCAVGYARKDRAIEAKAEELGIRLSEDDLAEIEERRKDNIKIYGSEMEYRRIVSSMYMSEDVFNYLTKIDYLGDYLFEYLYGAKGEKCSDKDISSYIEKEGYMCAKYIFLSNTDSDGNELTAEKREKNYKLLEDILVQLDSSDNPLALFVTHMNKYGEDKKVLNYPDGRLFVPGVMGKEFEKAYLELDKNEYSGIVKTDKGYYIILRMPFFPSMTADSAGNTLRYWVAYELFKNHVENCSEEMKIEYKDAYYEIDVEGLLR